MIRSLLKRLGIRHPIMLLRQSRDRKHRDQEKQQRDKQFQDWRRQRETEGALVHDSIEFTGAYPPYPFLQIEPGTHIERDVTIWLSDHPGAEPRLALSHVYIGRNTYLGVHYPIQIGRKTQIGAYCYLITANHRYDRRDIPIAEQGFIGAPIKIEDDVWIGTHVVILPGVTIGTGAVVAAGSVVNKNIPPYEVWGGVPAKLIKHRPD